MRQSCATVVAGIVVGAVVGALSLIILVSVAIILLGKYIHSGYPAVYAIPFFKVRYRNTIFNWFRKERSRGGSQVWVDVLMLHTQCELNSLSISRIVLLSATVHSASQGKPPILTLAELVPEPHPLEWLEMSLITHFRHQSRKETERRGSPPSCEGKKRTLMKGTCEGSQNPVH